jgi:hypothetical protein
LWSEERSGIVDCGIVELEMGREGRWDGRWDGRWEMGAQEWHEMGLEDGGEWEYIHKSILLILVAVSKIPLSICFASSKN